jgi:hypothetical protein
MAMDLDKLRDKMYTEKYTSDEARYLRDVVNKEDWLKENADQFGTVDPDGPDLSDPAAREQRIAELNNEIVERQQELARIAEEAGQPAVPPPTDPATQGPAPAPVGPETVPGDEGTPYENWTNDQLKAELKARNLPVGGKHDELVDRLYDDDEAKSPNE